MKIRNGFVSNSSSSSFVCDVCGAECSGMDIGIVDAGMYQCDNRHLFCTDHTVNKDEFDIAVRDKAINFLKKYKNISNPTEHDIDNILPDIIDDIHYSYPVQNCPVCNLETITDSILLQYVLIHYNVSRKSLENSMRQQFKNYDEFISEYKKRLENEN